MSDRFVRWAALFAALLLSLCLVDAGFVEPSSTLPAKPDVSAPEFSLELTARTQSGFAEEQEWALRIFREDRRLAPWGGAERHYVPVRTAEGKGPGMGKFHLPEGTYFLVAQAPGFSRVALRVDLHAPMQKELLFSPAARLDVTVFAQKNEDLIPLPGATVLVGEPGELPFGATTSKEGEAHFDQLSPGPARVRIFAPGYEPYEAMAEKSLVVRLRPASIVRVTVTSEGVVQAGAQVFIAGAALWPARVVVTGDKGYIDISGLKPGRYSLYAEKGNRISEVESEVEVLTLAGQVDVTLELLEGKYASVKVLARENEKPVEAARVTWSSAGLGQFSRHQFTEADGTVQVGPLRELGGVLTVRAAGFVPRIVPVELPSEREEGGEFQIIRLERSATIEGRVVDSEGFPVAGASIEVAGTDLYSMPVSVTHLRDEVTDAHFDWAEDLTNVLIPAGELGVMLGPVPPIPLSDVTPAAGRLLTTDKKGYFVARDVPPGELVVLARHPAHMDGRSAAFEVGPGGRKKVEIVLGRGKPLRGRVLDHEDFPVAGARIRVSARGFDRRVSAESDGTFSLEAAPEGVTLRISRIERPLQVLLATQVSKKERHEEITIRLPTPREPATISVTDEKGEQMELAQVTIVSLDRRVPFKSTRFSDGKGAATFDEARGLRVRLEVSSPGYVTHVGERRLKEENGVKLVEALRALGKVTGVRGRRAADGATVTWESGRITRQVVTNELGEYELTGLPPGLAELSGRHPEYGSGLLRIRLKADPSGRPIELPVLDLKPHVEVSGVVVNAQGTPIVGARIAADRIGPYLPLGSTTEILATSDEEGRFQVEVGRDEPLYLYAAAVGRLFGFSDAIAPGDLDRVEDVRILLDRKDKLPPDQRGTVLIALQEGATGLEIYSVARGSEAERAGLMPDDVIVEVDESRPRDVDDARELLSGVPGSDLRITISRRGSTMEIVTSREAFLR